MALIVYNRENSRPQEVTYKGKRTINLDSRGTVYLSKTMSIELGILGGGRVNFAHDDETGDWYKRRPKGRKYCLFVTFVAAC